jgi:hypothetical protein
MVKLMATIKLKHEIVMKTLDETKAALDFVILAEPSAGALGQNVLGYTKGWLEREKTIHLMVSQYVEIVRKNLEDTRANVDLLKEQDEAMVKK